MGLEEYYNKELSGKSGYITYEKDKYGYKIANGREYVEPATDGNDIYLTIDNNIQLFVENAVRSSQESSEAEWTLMVVADAKSGAILGYSSLPSLILILGILLLIWILLLIRLMNLDRR